MTTKETLERAKKIIIESNPGELELIKNLERLAAKSKPGLSKMAKANEVLKNFKQFQS